MIRIDGCGRIDIGVAHHELFQNVVLNRPVQFLRAHTLFLGGYDVEGHHRQHGAVHGHRHGHLPQWNPVKENFHVFDRVDRHSCFADVANHALVVRVVAAMCGQVEGNRKAFLSCRQIAPVERVRFLRS